MFWQSLLPHEALRWAGIFIAIAFVTWLGINALRRWLLQQNILDVPNNRSSHVAPTPRGAGIVMVGVIVICWLGLMVKHDVPVIYYGVALSAVVLAVVSWLDDQSHVPFLWRLAVHGAAAAVAVVSLPEHAVIFQEWLPLWLERSLMAIGLVWFLNLFNFMDGLDGLMGGLLLTIAAGIALITPLWLDWQLSLVIVPVALAFLWWNWSPAKIFSGDVGSVALGYIVGWMLLRLALSGYPVPAVILALYPIADTTITLLRRMSQGERFWVPHRNHFFQKLVRAGQSHSQVSRSILLLQCVMIALAWWAMERRVSPAFLSVLFVGGWLCYCQWRFRYSLGALAAIEDPATPTPFVEAREANKPDEK